MLSTWNKALLSGLLLWPAVSKGQEAVGPAGSWQHADGLWLGWQRSGSKVDPSIYLVDNGTVQLNRSVPARSQLASLNWTLGVGEKLERFALLDAQAIWERSVGRHRLSFGLTAGGSVFYGSTRYANLEDQFILGSDLSTENDAGTTDRWGAGINLADSIALSRTVDLTLDASRQQTRLRVQDTDQSESHIDSYGARLEKRWSQSRFQSSIRKTELDLGDTLNELGLRAEQKVLDMQARFLFPLAGRLNGGIGWQDLRSQGTDGVDRQLSGPEMGLEYAPRSSWSASILARALREKGDETNEGQLFGEANLTFRGDAQNSFQLGLNRQIDLLTSYRVFADQNLVAIDEQQDTLTGSAQWQHQRGRYRMTLSLVQSHQDFAESEADYSELSLSQIYEVTRRGQLSVVLGGRSSRFIAETPPVSIKRNFADLRLAWQEIMTGGLRPLGGRSFYRVETSYEYLDEEIADVVAERLTFLVSLGQLGNF
jgi:hypothetical protein